FLGLGGMPSGCEPGFLGLAHRPSTPGDQAESSLRLSKEVPAGRLTERRALLAAFDTARRDADASGSMAGMDSYQQQALGMILSGKVREALNLKREDGETLERYSGVESLLKARRLVEAGVGWVTGSSGPRDTDQGHV